VAGLTVLATAYLVGVRRVHGRGGSVPPARLRWFAAAVVVLTVALCSPLASVSERRFSAHMVQHLLLTYGAAPLLAFSAPVTLALHAAGPGAARRRLLVVLHSRVLRAVSHPVVAWVAFAAVMYATHFSGLYEASLRNPAVHGAEHLLYVSAAVLFWWPVVRRDPVPGSFPWPGRLLYLVVAMPLQSMLGLAIFSSDEPLYPHYVATLGRLAAIDDQHLAGAIMWVGGDILFLTSMFLILAGWMRFEKRHEVDVDRRLDAERAAIRLRESQLAERLATERLPTESLTADPEARP
jgi:putative copper resistance protein D